METRPLRPRPAFVARLLQSESGMHYLIAPDPEAHREPGSIQVLGDKSWNILALSGHYLLMRNHLEAVCLVFAVTWLHHWPL